MRGSLAPTTQILHSYLESTKAIAIYMHTDHTHTLRSVRRSEADVERLTQALARVEEALAMPFNDSAAFPPNLLQAQKEASARSLAEVPRHTHTTRTHMQTCIDTYTPNTAHIRDPHAGEGGARRGV